MANIFNAITTGVGGVATTGDSSGSFAFQSDGTTVASISSTGVITGDGSGLTSLDSPVASALNASGSAPIYACRAWVNFNGTGTVAIRASGNVSSITDNGTGNYTINFTTALSDTNYNTVFGNSGYAGYGLPSYPSYLSVGTKSTTSQQIYGGSPTATASTVWAVTDIVENSIAFFR